MAGGFKFSHSHKPVDKMKSRREKSEKVFLKSYLICYDRCKVIIILSSSSINVNSVRIVEYVYCACHLTAQCFPRARLFTVSDLFMVSWSRNTTKIYGM